MPSKNLFSSPFDDGTLFKLKIFKDYFKEWLPVFISSEKPIWKKVRVFDLFAGKGKDQNGSVGSPLILLEEINKWSLTIQNSKVNLEVVLNEYDRAGYGALTINAEEIADPKTYSLKIYNEDFKAVFDRYYPSMTSSANFLFLDQNGIKQITEVVFKQVIELGQTDFIFFISSSFIKRFADSESFQKYLKISRQDLEGKSYYHIHRIVLDYYRSLIPAEKKYYIAPFSIKKPAGIYGLIFGSNHIYGLEKFLSVCWKHDQLTGEANFDIDNEKIDTKKPSLFAEYNVPKKIQVFEQRLRNGILNNEITTDLMAYVFSLEEGFLPKHANQVLADMKSERLISFDFKLISGKVHRISIASKIHLR